MTVTSRPYQEGDYLTHIESLIEINMKDLFIKNFGGWSKVVSKNKFFEVLETGFVELFFENEKFIGYVSVSPERNNETSYLIHDIHIKKEFQGKGYGKKILSFVEDKARKNNISQLVAFVFKNNPAIDFYRSQKFTDSKKGKEHTFIVIKNLN